MNKLFAVFALSLALSAPAVIASERGDCLKNVKQTLKTDEAACKEMKGKEKKSCIRDARKKAKDAKAACPAK